MISATTVAIVGVVVIALFAVITAVGEAKVKRARRERVNRDVVLYRALSVVKTYR